MVPSCTLMPSLMKWDRVYSDSWRSSAPSRWSMVSTLATEGAGGY